MGNFMSNIPHFFNKIIASGDGWFDFHNLYYNVVKDATEDRKYIFAEIGCWKGASTSFMAVEIANSEKDIDFYCIDTWKGSTEHRDRDNGAFDPMCFEQDGIFPIFMKNMEPVKDYIKPIQKSSLEASYDFPDDYFDFVFIDASHEYEHVKTDIENWFPKVKSGGVLAGHDYGWKGVVDALKEFAEVKSLTVYELPHDGPSWLIQK